MAKAGKILIYVGITLSACSTKYNEVEPETELVVTIKNDTGTPLDKADVYVFDDLTAYNQTAATGAPAGFLATAQTNQGTVTITNLPFDKQLYVYAGYQDKDLFPGTYITFDNSTENFNLKNPLARGSVTSLEIILKAADGFITFWTQETNSAALPIDVFLGGNPDGTLAQTALSPPGVFESNGLTVRVRKGNINIEGKSSTGCLWTNQISTALGKNITYQLSNCAVGTVAFYTDSSNASKLPISLTLNSNDDIGNITSATTIIPTDCSAVNLSIALRVPGNYTYEAVSPSGSCIWTGTFTVTAYGCTLIPLPTCN
jgi:hypothetical protein